METDTLVIDQDESNDDFMAGISGAPTATPEPATELVKTEVPTPALHVANLTEDELIALRVSAAMVPEIKATLEKQFGTAFGKIGGIERALNERKGVAVGKLSGAEFKRLGEANFGEFATLLADDLSEILASKITAAPAAAAIEPARVEEIINARVEKVKQEMQVDRLDDLQADWREVVYTPAFSKFVGTLPEADRTRLNGWDARFIAKKVTEFKAASAPKPAPKPADTTRKNRLAEAVTPRGVGGHAPAPSSDDDYMAGIKSATS